jgi:hypothetical protein
VISQETCDYSFIEPCFLFQNREIRLKVHFFIEENDFIEVGLCVVTKNNDGHMEQKPECRYTTECVELFKVFLNDSRISLHCLYNSK